MADSSPDEVMRVLSRRVDLLREIGPKPVEKRDLVTGLDISRSTVDRGVRELLSVDLVEREGSGYRRTLAGELAFDAYETYENRVRGLTATLNALSILSPDVPLDGVVLEDAEITRPDRHSPNRPITHLKELIDRADHVRAIASAVLPQQVDLYRTQIVDCNMTVEMVVPDAVLEHLITTYKVPFQDALATGRLTIRTTVEDFPYSMVVADVENGREVAVLIYGDDGVKALIRTDAPAAVRWADAQFEQWWEPADPLPGQLER